MTDFPSSRQRADSPRKDSPRDDGPRVFDRAFADTLYRLDPRTDARVLAAAERASFAIAQGHAALDLAAEEDPEGIRDALRASRWAATPMADEPADPAMPLVLEGGLLYLRRYREYERRLAGGLRRIAGARIEAGDVDALAPLFDALFPPHAHDPHQARAAGLALRQSLLLITGGPGTGKTTTIARMLLLAIAQCAVCRARVAHCARRTDRRAAERMAQSLRSAVDLLRGAGIDGALCDALPTDAGTLHRLLGTIPDRPRFRHGAGSAAGLRPRRRR